MGDYRAIQNICLGYTMNFIGNL